MEVEQYITKGDSSEDEGVVVKKKTLKFQIVDSDDDAIVSYDQKASENDLEEEENFTSTKKPRKSRLLRNTESDSENETPTDGKDVEENQHKQVDCYALFRDKEDLYDADGSEEEGDGISANEEYTEPKKRKGSSSLNEKKLERKSKAKAMSVMQQIHSETQRLVRESPVSLPYHRPRQRTLAEFLQRRKPLGGTEISARLNLNLPTEKLTEVWKHLEEREKEAEKFYKSESEDSEKESESKKTQEHQDQPNGTADSGVHSLQSPETFLPNEQMEVNETVNNLEKDVTSIAISCDIDAAEDRKHMIEVSSTYKDTMKFNVFQKPDMKSKDTTHNNVSLIGCENSKIDLIENKTNDVVLINREEDVSDSTKSAINSVRAFCLENTETQFNLFSNNTKNLEKDKTHLNNSEGASENSGLKEVYTHEAADTNSNEIQNFNFLHPKEVNESLENIDQGAVKKRDIDVELHAEMMNASQSMGTQDFTLHWSETESMDTADIPQRSLSLLGIQTENKVVLEERTSASKPTNKVAHSDGNNLACGSYTQNFHLHYSESLSSDKDNEGANETGTCTLPPQADEENAMDITLNNKESREMEDNNKNSNSVQENEKLTAEWLHNIQPPSDDSDEEKPKQNKKLLNIARNSFPGLGDITKLQPRLSDTPNGIIDLDEDVTDKGGVVKFVQRFMKHSAAVVKKKPTRKTKEISVVSAEKNTEGIETVQKDVVTVLLGDDDPAEDPALAKPGAKLQRLKEELQQQMAQKRAEEWQKRQQEQKLDNEDLDAGELSDCGAKEEEEIEEEMTDRETTDSEAEDEEEEDDVPLVEKKRIRSAFVDEEAEESEQDGADEDEDEDGAGSEIGNDEEKSASIRSNDENNEEEEETASTNFDNIDKDVDSSESNSSKKPKLERVKTFDLFASQDDTTQEVQGEQDLPLTSSLIPAYQLVRDCTKEDEPKKSVFELISPASDLTPLRSRSHLRSVSQTPLTVMSMSSCDRSPIVTQQKPKRLFTDSEPISTQEHMDELLDLCSGKFSHSAPNHGDGVVGGGIEQLVDRTEGTKEDLEQELLGLCSGKFTSIQRQDTELLEPSSQFLSAKNTWKSLTIVSSDEEDEGQSVVKGRSERKGIHKKLAFSDDEEDEDQEEELTDKDSVEGDSEDGGEEPNENIVEYDSEENEIIIAPEAKKVSRKKMAEYFENEAELSESDWDSADEDERGLNKLEKEEGDDDQLDQEEVKEQLGKIHMRRVLDEDKREVRLLQEILFEDGELHSEGGGRERKFRWKNIDNIDENDLARRDSDDEGMGYDDEEDEAEWRRMRHEREVFLQKLKEKAERGPGEELLEDEDSRLLKLGKAALKRIQRCNSQDTSEKPTSLCRSSSAPQISPDPKHPFKLLTKRGSFLARGESALARIAQMTSESVNIVSRPKNTRNFVFARLSPEKEEDSSLGEKPEKAVKRCSTESTPPVVKRLKMFDENSRGKKLLDLLM